ncbi:MAG: Na/Pi cotransporter family protein [Clostridia bacterium]|nr:Na/Pi cotransporter family protein [Clostridia bacterium]
MDLFDAFTFLGGISLFLFGMKLLSQALEKKAGGSMAGLLSRFTSNKLSGFLLGTVVTALMQSSSATTVMVIGLVNAGILTLSQSVPITIGANLGTTITAWILSLNALGGEAVWVRLLQPSAFVPVLAFIGVICFAFLKSSRKKDFGMILLSFAILMFGMETAAAAVEGLGELDVVRELFLAFSNPLLGILIGAALTAVLQSSSVSIGILQAFCMTGQVRIGAAFPIILGQNLGACVPTLAAAIGAEKNAKRAAIIRLNFNLCSIALNLVLFFLIDRFAVPLSAIQATPVRVAILHTAVNLLSAIVFLPLSSLLERSTMLFVKPDETPKQKEFPLDERLFVNPGLAILQAKRTVADMARDTVGAFTDAGTLLTTFDERRAKEIKATEKEIDRCEDAVDNYLVQLITQALSEQDSRALTELLHATAAFERISDHAVHLAVYGERLSKQSAGFAPETSKELSTLMDAVNEALRLTLAAFADNDLAAAHDVEPLEQVVDELTETLRQRQEKRWKTAPADAELEVLFSDALTVLERVSDLCSDIAAGRIEIHEGSMELHDYVRTVKATGAPFEDRVAAYRKQFAV